MEEAAHESFASAAEVIEENRNVIVPVLVGGVLGVGLGAALLWAAANKRYPLAPPRSAVLVTGASSGIGKSAVFALAKAGFVVYAGVRKTEDANALRREAAALGKERGKEKGSEKKGTAKENQRTSARPAIDVRPIRLDVTKDEDCKRAVITLRESGLPVAGIVNNAGVVERGPVEMVGHVCVIHTARTLFIAYTRTLFLHAQTDDRSQ